MKRLHEKLTKPSGKTMPKGRTTPEPLIEKIKAYLEKHREDIASKKISLNSVADKFDVNFSVVKTQADRLQIFVTRGGPRSSKNRAKVLKMIAEGKGPTEISDKLGISRQEVYRLKDSPDGNKTS